MKTASINVSHPYLAESVVLQFVGKLASAVDGIPYLGTRRDTRILRLNLRKGSMLISYGIILYRSTLACHDNVVQRAHCCCTCSAAIDSTLRKISFRCVPLQAITAVVNGPPKSLVLRSRSNTQLSVPGAVLVQGGAKSRP